MSDIWPRRPRDWQVKALGDWVARRQRDYLMAVCPGGGKTAAALAIARYALDQGMVKKVVVVSPTEPLTRQWCDKAAEFGISLDPDADSKAPFNHPGQYVGVSTTYQAVARGGAHAFNTALNIHATLVILDEVHHTGEQLAWGDAALKAFELASYRVLLSGTPKRSDTARIAFATYGLNADGQQRIRRDFSYGTGRGVRDFVIRRTDCRFYDAEIKEIPYGQQVAVSRNLSAALRRDDVSDLLTAVMDPSSGWLAELMGSVNKELSAIRRTVPDAGCLILADDQAKAKAYATIVEKTTGRRPAVVISEDKDAKDTLEAYAQSTDPYLIAVRMVSEGVDIPRLRVLVYLTRTKTELFFAQATARVVRIPDQRDTDPAVIFMPALPVLRELAQGIEDDVVHEIAVLEQEISADAAGPRPASEPPGPAQADAAAPPGTYPAQLADGDELEFISSLPVGPDGQMSLLPATVSVDNIALQHTLLGSHGQEPYWHFEAQNVIDRYGYPQTTVGFIRRMMSDGLVKVPSARTDEQPAPAEQSAADAAPVADFRIREHLRKELERLARRIARQHFNDNFTGVRAQINKETGAYAQYGNNHQLKGGIAYAKQWLAQLAAGTAR